MLRPLALPDTGLPHPLPEMRVDEVDFDYLHYLGERVIEPIPVEHRASYTYWRALHLAKVGMNFARGIPILNAGRSRRAHFTDDYTYALKVAGALAVDEMATQFTRNDRDELRAYTGLELEAGLPAMVVALGARPAVSSSPTRGMQRGVVVHGYLSLDDIDPYSREFIEQTLLK